MANAMLSFHETDVTDQIGDPPPVGFLSCGKWIGGFGTANPKQTWLWIVPVAALL